MKKIVWLCLIAFITILTSCSNLEELDPQVESDAISYYGKVVKLSDFPSDKLLKQSEIDSINNAEDLSGMVGASAETALVDLIFDKNEVLYTAKRYNTEAEESTRDEIGSEFYYTDLETFRLVTNLSEATSEYVDVLLNLEGRSVWSFDPYVEFFEKTDFSVEDIDSYDYIALKSYTRNAWSKLGNIIYARWDDDGISDRFGHTGGITKEPSASSSNIGYLMRSTKTMEASNRGKNLAGISIGTPDGVFERCMSSDGTDGWNSDLVYRRYALWYSDMTSSERKAIARYMQKQEGEDYNFGSSKRNRSQWYCSKLQWAAYKEILDIDIDRNKGSKVYPNDIKNSPLLVGVCF